MNESKKLKEVWEWKENVYEKTKGMNQKERVDFFNNGLKDFIKRTGIDLKVEKKEKHTIGSSTYR
jgi:hypothetical protein